MSEPAGLIDRVADLPSEIGRALSDFVDAARKAFGGELESIVLFGSGAEGALRPTSDVNVVVVLASFDATKAAALRDAFRAAHAAANLVAMYLLRAEVAAAAEAFAQKFADIGRRHRVLYGDDPFATLSVPREALIARLSQVLLNLTLRLRAAYIERGLREEQLAHVIADVAGPLRTCAANLMALEGDAPPSPKESLELLIRSFEEPGWSEILENLTRARQGGALPPGVADRTLTRLIELTERMRARASALR